MSSDIVARIIAEAFILLACGGIAQRVASDIGAAKALFKQGLASGVIWLLLGQALRSAQAILTELLAARDWGNSGPAGVLSGSATTLTALAVGYLFYVVWFKKRGDIS